MAKLGRPPKKIIENIYDQEVIGGIKFFRKLAERLNNRYADGWKFQHVYSLGGNEYAILYKKLEGIAIHGEISEKEPPEMLEYTHKNKFFLDESDGAK